MQYRQLSIVIMVMMLVGQAHAAGGDALSKGLLAANDAAGNNALPKGVTAVNDRVSLNFVDADIESVIKAIGMISNTNFLIDPRVKGVININTSKPVPKAMTYQILLAALRVQGFAAVEANGVITIVPEADAKTRFSASLENGKSSKGQIVTRVYVLKNESAGQMANVVKPLMSANSVVTPYLGNNALIITDYADNIGKISRLIDSIDQLSSMENTIINLKYASAVELAQTLTKLLSDTNSADPAKRLLAIAEPRTNSIILKADTKNTISRALQIVQKLDVPTANAGSTIHVVYLKNADATKLATTLRALISGKGLAENNISTLNNRAGTQTIDNATASPTTNAGTGTPNTAVLASPFSPLAGAQENGMIQADVATNSLLITAPDRIYNMLRAVIEQLDIRRAQLYIEALIAEVSTDKAFEFGIQWQQLEAFKPGNIATGNIQGFAGTNFSRAGGNILGVASNLSTAGQGLNIGIMAGQVNIPGIGSVTNLGVLAHALETNANGNILSKPNLLTLDNEEAKIVIGQNVPFLTGQYAQTGSTTTVTPFQTVERQDVGITLKVKPQISEGKTIKLQIYQEVSSVNSTALNAGVTTNKRAINTSVLVDDGSIIVLGGLIENKTTDDVSKVPFLGDIPGLGVLFKSTTRRNIKTNLMVFLRPYVLKSSEDTTRISNERYEYIMQKQLPLTHDATNLGDSNNTAPLKMDKNLKK